MIALNKTWKFSGIYKISKKNSSDCYIGSSKCIYQRLQHHLYDLRKQIHKNEHLQRAWNKYGEDSFEFSIIEQCDPEIRIEREQFYVDTLKPSYNMCREVVELPPYNDPEHKKKLSEIIRKNYAEGKVNISWAKKVYQYDLEGNYIKEFSSAVEAAKTLNLTLSNVRRNLYGVFKHCKDWMFSFEKHDKIEPYNPKKKEYKKKHVLVWNDEEYYEFDSVNAVAEYFKVKVRRVMENCQKGRKFLRKYMIKYKDAQTTE